MKISNNDINLIKYFIKNNKKNIIFSSFGVKNVLEMLRLSANGNTKKEIENFGKFNNKVGKLKYSDTITDRELLCPLDIIVKHKK